MPSKPVDALELSSLQQGERGEFPQSCQLVVHPRLNVLYECSLNASRKTLDIYGFSISDDGKLLPLGDAPNSLDIGGYPFRGEATGIAVCLEPTGNYLYLTQNSLGSATGQLPEIPYYRLNSQGLIDSKAMSTRLDLPQSSFYCINLEPGHPGSHSVYGFLAPCDSPTNGSSACHFTIQPDGAFKTDSQVHLSDSAVFRTQSAGGFLRNTTWGSWEGLRLDDSGRLLDAYCWPRPGAGVSLFELDSDQAVGISHSKDSTEARLFALDSRTDRPSASPLTVKMPRFYPEPGKTLTDAQAHQVFFFDENAEGLEVTRIGMRGGRLCGCKPQKLEGCGPLNGGFGTIQILSVY